MLGFGCLYSLTAVIAAPWSKTVQAAEFVKADTVRPGAADYVTESGSLSGRANGQKRSVTGWFDYEFDAPEAGWYELLADPQASRSEFIIDGEISFSPRSRSKVGNVWLTAGRHTVRVQRYHWEGFGDLRQITLRRSDDSLAQTMRYTIAGTGRVLSKGDKLRLIIQGGGRRSAADLTLTLHRNRGGDVVTTKDVMIPSGEAPRDIEVGLPLPEEGIFELRFSSGGKPITDDIPPVQVIVVDTAQVPASAAEPKRTLVAEIDCVARAPDYFKGGETRVVAKSFGRYREGGDVGYLQNMNAEKPSWFAYTTSIPRLGNPYIVEIDYPNDSYRTTIAQIRQGPPEIGGNPTHAYVMGVGADTGGEFTLSHRLETLSVLVWPTSRDWRINLITPQNGSRPAASRIRIYELPEGISPMPGRTDGRTYAQWYEEGFSYLSVFGGSNQSAEDLMRGTDQWLRSAAYAGANAVVPTVSVYQMAMYPSRYNTAFCTPETFDAVRLILLYCEKYGMRFAGEFHPEARELMWMEDRGLDDRKNSLRNSKGKFGDQSARFSPVHPVNQTWYLGMLKEFAARYHDSRAFEGVSLRIMRWANPALNNFHSLDWGYDDYTVELFEKETGIDVPVAADDPLRFGKRHSWLVNHEKARWIAWRCDKVTELHRKIVAEVRSVRPDLLVYLDAGDAARAEMGLDLPALAKIDGLVLVQNVGTYGRRKAMLVNQATRDKLVAPGAMDALLNLGAKPSYAIGQAYFEATQKVAPPADLGYPENTPHGWMSGAVEPAGAHSVERWALMLAETDARFLRDGGNAYTLGQPRNREFFRQYRRLPDIAFTAREDARDPVAVWSAEDRDGFWFYAVNREAYDLPISLDLRTNGDVVRVVDDRVESVRFGRLNKVLKPYELMVWRAPHGSRIDAVRVKPPANEVAKVRAQVEWIEALAKRITRTDFPVTIAPDRQAKVKDAATNARTAFNQGRLRAARNYLEHSDLVQLYETLKQYPPQLRDNGTLKTPKTAMDAEALSRLIGQQARIALAEAERVSRSWTGERLLVTEGQTMALRVETDVDGRFILQLGVADGGDFGGKGEVLMDGAVVGTFMGKTGGDVVGRHLAFEAAISLERGAHELTLRRASGGGRLGVQFVELTPLRDPLVAGAWSLHGPIAVDFSGGPAQQNDAVLAAMGRAFPVEEAAEAEWRMLQGDSAYVDFREATGGEFGTIHYARTYLYSPNDYVVRLSYGTDYWARIWLNGELVQDTHTPGGAPVPYGFHRNLPLKKGSNELLFKVASGNDGNGLWAAITNPGNIRASATIVN